MTDRSNLRDAQVLGALEAELVPGASAAAPQPAARSPSAEDARLAELARIVNQNDRFRDLLRPPGQPAARREPSFDDAPSPDWDVGVVEEPGRLHAYSSQSYQPEVAADAAQDWRLQPAQTGETWDQQPHGVAAAAPRMQGDDWQGEAWSGQVASDHAHAPYAAPPAVPQSPYGAQPVSYAADDFAAGYPGAPDPLHALEGARMRRHRPARAPLVAAVAMVAVCAAASAGYFFIGRSSGVGGANGEAPVIRADASPVKVAPPAENTADPAATREIYEQLAKPSANTRVVANNEQPVDVEQTLRQQRAAAIAAGRLPSEVSDEIGSMGAAVPAPLPVPGGHRDPRDGLGEPKRVRTVSIGPDGKVRGGDQIAALAAKPVPAPTPTPVAKQEHRVPSMLVDSTTTGSVGGAPTQKPAPKPAPKVAVARAPEAPKAAPVGKGGFAVQLGAPGSEEEARKLVASLKRKFNVLAAHNTAVVRAESNGRTVYRVRVPGLSRESANSLCSQLKSVGGSCFVAQG